MRLRVWFDACGPVFLATLLVLSTQFMYYPDNIKLQFVTELRQCMAVDLDEQNLYVALNYKKKRFRKAELQDHLLHYNGSNTHKYVYHYLADYFCINLIEKRNAFVTTLNTFCPQRYTIILTVNPQRGTISCSLEPQRGPGPDSS